MPIFYSSEDRAWSLRDVTEEESKLLLDLGMSAITQLIGAGILRKLQEKFEARDDMPELEDIPKEHMGSA